MASETVPKVPVYSVNDLKNTTDDALAPYLANLPEPYTFTQDHTLSNVRFALGYSAVAIAAGIFYVDRKLGWESTNAPWVLPAVVVYFALNSILTYWVWGVEAGEVFRGKRKTGEKVWFEVLFMIPIEIDHGGSGEIGTANSELALQITVRSSAKKHSPLYKLNVKYTSPEGRVLQQKDIETSFTVWFSSDGVFHPEPFRQWLAKEIEVLGLASKEAARKGQ
ncbi:signal peptidase complex component, putative [Paecilomyces variotii No. 5]|uniref:Signal peptidase complex subunit 2 n=1 Tax=Byssochlamys spectabilis (strain No. 5 / NBRC 109023) TaxID=1356009 RepID=V5FQF0_BYSSN|nr:signal peptidase complex component, putative [Paecilomyces variotii No. 5]